MQQNTFLARIAPQCWTLLALSAWGGALLAFHVIRIDLYGIDEAAARALLLNWTVADQVVNPIVIFGAPDFRALLFLPLGIYWPGSIVAVKIFGLLIGFAAALLLYRWESQREDDEAALLASGLLLIAPITIAELNAMDSGPYLVLCFGLGWWLNDKYRAAQRPLGGWYFAQMLLTVLTVNLHPAGLAYPLALAWQWHKAAVDRRQQRHFYIGLGIATTIALLLGMGWPALEWFSNPLVALTHTVIAGHPDEKVEALWGLIPGLLWLMLLATDFRRIVDDLVSRMLLLATLLGLLVGDHAWAFCVVTLVLYRGVPVLIRFNQGIGKASLVGKRGIVLVIVFLLATLFMTADRVMRDTMLAGELSPSDSLIQHLANQTAGTPTAIHITSQWPGRTMLATKLPVFPLPPVAGDPDKLLEMLKGVDYLLFDPNTAANIDLTRQISQLPALETVDVSSGGVIMRVRKEQSLAAPSH